MRAIINGAGKGLKLLGGIVALLIAFIGLLALVNLGLGWAGGLVNGLLRWDAERAGGPLKGPRSAIIASYALCGFAHVASLAIFIGGTGALVPTRVRDISRIGFRAPLAAALACLLTGGGAGHVLP